MAPPTGRDYVWASRRVFPGAGTEDREGILDDRASGGAPETPTAGPASPAPAGRSYRVRIEYAEPEFHRRNPHCPEAYTALFDCSEARDTQEAIAMALMEFDLYARWSRVAWRRVVRAITVE